MEQTLTFSHLWSAALIDFSYWKWKSTIFLGFSNTLNPIKAKLIKSEKFYSSTLITIYFVLCKLLINSNQSILASTRTSKIRALLIRTYHPSPFQPFFLPPFQTYSLFFLFKTAENKTRVFFFCIYFSWPFLFLFYVKTLIIMNSIFSTIFFL